MILPGKFLFMENKFGDLNAYPLKVETSAILAIGVDIHTTLGPGFLEIVYKDAFEYEFRRKNILFDREKKYEILYKGIILPHCFYADFTVFDKIILEIKSSEAGIAPEMFAQTINYLKASGLKVGLIINFGKLKIDVRRVIF